MVLHPEAIRNFGYNLKVPASVTPLHFLLAVCCTVYVTVATASSADTPPLNEKRVYNTEKINSAPPRIDGVIDDPCWKQGIWTGDFKQQMPAEGVPPGQKTEFKILFDNGNIYVAFRVYETNPSLIDRQLSRRDERVGDIVGITFDSYFDHRTGFEFDVTAAGARLDLIMTNDGFDPNWNPVWDCATSLWDSGWTAELKIPLGQLRYGNREDQVWGLHVWRWINRNRESDHWNLIPRDNAGYLYHFGEMHGLGKLPPVRRVEFMPYVVGKVNTYRKEDGNPFADGFDPGLSVGLDGKIGIGSNFTVDYTINPDFGQVEADPSELNLSAFETYYEEKRPFFIEGRNIFDFSFEDNQMFYSRRIGHTPMYEPETAEGEYLRQPDNTSILGALKLTGKTSTGWSVGLLESITSREYATLSDGSRQYNVEAEPLTNYLGGRVQKDINGSNTMIGGMVTSTNRVIDKEHLGYIPASAQTAGVDLLHYIKDKTYFVEFKALISQVTGTPEAITGLQKASSRYYQRPDAPHISIDTTASRLTGYGGILDFMKGAKGHWRYGIGTEWQSPGLELNDMGFQNLADQIWEGQMVGYVENEPKGIFRTYEISLSQLNYWNFGGEYLRSEAELEAEALLENKWEISVDMGREGKSYHTGLLRGGPGVFIPGESELEFRISTDEAKKLTLSLEQENSFSDDGVTREFVISPSLGLKATTSLQLSTTFSYEYGTENLQYIRNKDLESSGQYLLGRLDRKTWMLTFRLSYALTPDFTIQYYGSPYITTGTYTDFKTLADADSHNPENVFRSFAQDELIYEVGLRQYRLYEEGTPDPVLSFDNPNFNFRELRSNLVARWEYRPGSVFYLVWTHNRTSSENITNQDPGYNLRKLFNTPADNVFLVKFSYWFSR
jgi:hypothetical protein